MIDGRRKSPKGPAPWRQKLYVSIGKTSQVNYCFGRYEMVTFGTAVTNKIQVWGTRLPESIILFELRRDEKFVFNFDQHTFGHIVPPSIRIKLYLQEIRTLCDQDNQTQRAALALGQGYYQLELEPRTKGWIKIGSVILHFQCVDLEDNSHKFIH